MYSRGANPIWSFVDLVGAQLDDTYYISFLSNTFPYLPQAVYQDNEGTTPWSQPIEFLPNGTLPDNIYGDESLVYRIEIRQGPTQFDQLIYLINNYLFQDTGSSTTTAIAEQVNQISNPQFAYVNFNLPGISPIQLTLLSAGTYNIAPGWQIILAGSGTCTLTQVINAANQTTSSNNVPPYFLRVNSNGWSSVILQQQLNGNGALWVNNYLSASINALSESGFAQPVSISYVPSGSSAVPIVVAAPLSTGNFAVIQGVTGSVIPASSSSASNSVSYIDIQILLPGTSIIDISDVQVIPSADPITLPFASAPDDSLERQMDYLFHYYNPLLQYKPIPSWLVGWDFPLNPRQNGSTYSATGGANTSAYVADQTIMFQSAASGIGVTAGPSNELVLTATTGTQVAIIQYLCSPTVNDLLNSDSLSVFLAANTTNSGGVACTVSLWYTTAGSLPAINSGNSLVATLDSSGKPATFHDSWAEVPRLNGEQATIILGSQSTANFSEYQLSGWSLNGFTGAQAAQFFAIVVGFASITTSATISIDSVGLYSGNIATRPAPQSADEVFRQCQYFYEKSYSIGSPPTSATSVGSKFRNGVIYNDQVGSLGCVLYANEFEVPFFQQKRVTPSLALYSVSGTLNTIQTAIRVGNSLPSPSSGANPRDTATSVWGTPIISPSNFIFTTNNSSVLSGIMAISTAQPAAVGELFFHYVADARLGVI